MTTQHDETGLGDLITAIEDTLGLLNDAKSTKDKAQAIKQIRKSVKKSYEALHVVLDWQRSLKKPVQEYDFTIPRDRELAMRALYDVLEAIPMDVVMEAWKTRLHMDRGSKELREEVRELLRRDVNIPAVNTFIFLRDEGHVALDKRSKEAA